MNPWDVLAWAFVGTCVVVLGAVAAIAVFGVIDSRRRGRGL